MDINFDLNKYPTLRAFTEDDSYIRIVVGPAGCLSGDTEVYTPRGWVRLDQFDQDQALVYFPTDGKARMAPVGFNKHPAQTLFHYKSPHASVVFCEEHIMPTRSVRSREVALHQWESITGAQWVVEAPEDRYIATSFVIDQGEWEVDDLPEIATWLYLVVHGLPTQGEVVVETTTHAKAIRLKQILEASSLSFSHEVSGTYLYTHTFHIQAHGLDYTPQDLMSLPQAAMEVLVRDMLEWHWHGWKGEPELAQAIQFLFVASGYHCVYSEEQGEGHAQYSMLHTHSAVAVQPGQIEEVVPEDGQKYCLTTDTGMFVIRHNGHVSITGNSAKTSWMVMEILKLASQQEPNAEGRRYTKFLVGRLTYQVLVSATVDTFRRMAPQLFHIKSSTPPTATANFSLPDGTSVHILVEFLSFDSEDAQEKLLGYEPTFVFLDEVSELPESLVMACVRRLGRYPSGQLGTPTRTGLFGATNGPRKNHWLYEWASGRRDEEFALLSKEMGVNYFRLFRQPPALLRPRREGDKWQPNPKAENIHNLKLGYGYYYGMLSGKDADIQAYVEGEFADLVVGKPVFPEFNRDIHTFPSQDFNYKQGLPLYLAFDFGLTPVCIIAVMTAGGGLRVVSEVMGENMSIETLCDTVLLPHLRTQFPNSWVERAWGDPAGDYPTQATDVSPFDVLMSKGIPIEAPDVSNRLDPRIEAVKQHLTKLDGMGKPLLQIADNCKYLIASLATDYIYELVRGGGGTVRDTPTKSHVNWVSDLADAIQYLCLGVRTMTMGRQTSKLPPLRTRFM